MKSNQVIVMIIVAVVAIGAGFFGGMKYQQSQRISAFANGGFGRGQAGVGGRFGNDSRGPGGGATIGQIVNQDANSITVKLPDGSSKIVNISKSTTISKTTTGVMSDLTTDAQVAVFGTTNSDGSVTAQNIQLNPMFRRFGGDGSPKPTQ